MNRKMKIIAAETIQTRTGGRWRTARATASGGKFRYLYKTRFGSGNDLFWTVPNSSGTDLLEGSFHADDWRVKRQMRRVPMAGVLIVHPDESVELFQVPVHLVANIGGVVLACNQHSDVSVDVKTVVVRSGDMTPGEFRRALRDQFGGTTTLSNSCQTCGQSSRGGVG